MIAQQFGALVYLDAKQCAIIKYKFEFNLRHLSHFHNDLKHMLFVDEINIVTHIFESRKKVMTFLESVRNLRCIF